MNTIEILLQTIDALSKYAGSLEAQLDAAGIKYNKQTVPVVEVSPEPVKCLPEDVIPTKEHQQKVTLDNLLWQGIDKTTKKLTTYLEHSKEYDNLIKSTCRIASVLTDCQGTNIADQNVLVSKDNQVAVCESYKPNILMIDFNTGKTIHKLPITNELDVQALQDTLDKEGWTIFTTTLETQSYLLNKEDVDHD